MESGSPSRLRMLRQMEFICIPLASYLTTAPKCFTLTSNLRVIILRVKMLLLGGGTVAVKGQRGGPSGAASPAQMALLIGAGRSGSPVKRRNPGVGTNVSWWSPPVNKIYNSDAREMAQWVKVIVPGLRIGVQFLELL